MKNKNEIVGYYHEDFADVIDAMQRVKQENVNRDYGCLETTMTTPQHALDLIKEYIARNNVSCLFNSDESLLYCGRNSGRGGLRDTLKFIDKTHPLDMASENSDSVNKMMKMIEFNNNEMLAMYPNKAIALEDLRASASGKTFMVFARNSGSRGYDNAIDNTMRQPAVRGVLPVMSPSFNRNRELSMLVAGSFAHKLPLRQSVVQEDVDGESLYGRFDIMYDELGYLNRRHYRPLMGFETQNVFVKSRDMFSPTQHVSEPFSYNFDILRDSYKLVDMEEEVFGNVIPKHRLDIETIRMILGINESKEEVFENRKTRRANKTKY